MELKNIDNKYLEACVKLAVGQFQKEQEMVPALYHKYDEQQSYKSLKWLFDNGSGIIALEQDEPIGFLCFGKVQENQSSGLRSASSPICGYGISNEGGYDREKIASLLFQHASKQLHESGVKDFYLTVYAHEREVITSYVLNQFGILCTDAIRFTDSPRTLHWNENYEYVEFTPDEIKDASEELLELWRDLVEHLRQSPTYYPGAEFTDELFQIYIKEEGTRVFVAKDNDVIIGMMNVTNSSNHFATTEQDTLNVSDLYVKPAYRGQQVADSLLSYISKTLRREQINRIWVEHGTTNPTAQRFWGRHFDSFTYTLTRKLEL